MPGIAEDANNAGTAGPLSSSTSCPFSRSVATTVRGSTPSSNRRSRVVARSQLAKPIGAHGEVPPTGEAG